MMIFTVLMKTGCVLDGTLDSLPTARSAPSNTRTGDISHWRTQLTEPRRNARIVEKRQLLMVWLLRLYQVNRLNVEISRTTPLAIARVARYAYIHVTRNGFQGMTSLSKVIYYHCFQLLFLCEIEFSPSAPLI